MEIWADFPGFEEYYEISSLGNARSKERRYRNNSGRLIIRHSKILKPLVGSNGYIRYWLKKPNDDKVYKVLVKDGNELRFDSLTSAAKFLNRTVGAVSMAKNHGGLCNGYFVLDLPVAESGVVDADSDTDENSAVSAICVALCKGDETIYCNSISSAARKLNRNISSVITALYSGNKCNGYNVYKIC